jgi:[acyl-carrier-protein] S-malonyltransferase
MFAAWLELPGVDETVGQFSELIGLDLRRLGTTADADEIKDTAVTQPLIVALGVIVAEALAAEGSFVCAGHSIGEVTAAAVAGVLSASDAVALAARRGAGMAAACALTPTGMAAVLGGDPDTVADAITAAGLTAANRNGAGQIVAAGELDKLASFVENPPAGTRVRPLQVAGAFHTAFMAPAQESLAAFAADLTVHDPRHILLSNADGTAVASGAEVVARLVGQVTQPVRWDLCQRTMADLGVTGIIELAPAGTLTGLAKRELAGVQLLALKSPEDLEAAAGMIASRPEHSQGEHIPEFTIAVTPSKGVFTRAEGLDEGAPVARGAKLGTVRTNRDEHAILATGAGVLLEWLRHDGDIVAAGLPVARLYNGSDAG